GVQIIPVGHGELASGLVGDGRMAEPEAIVDFLEASLLRSTALQGKQVLITAGPTFEALDPVRFIGNHSTGKMGIALAEALARLGATIRLVLGPTALEPSHPGIEIIRVQSAQEMFEACSRIFPETDIAVLAAAVADYRPKTVAHEKIKKQDQEFQLELTKTVDIAASLGREKRPGQVLVGFALETQNEQSNARLKMEKKNFDFIVLNSLRDTGAGFGHDTNKITILRRDGSQTDFDLKSKTAVAEDIAVEIVNLANPRAKKSVSAE
ncbi:MAG: bifunctional phosphopantothenoylcysteine decarboxylase/phosphopantothenate--cysteine ligase CoaBC, partial [Saprospiraceae bacterium]|nr:bifunctional phosphopantothenoylcysteine decarboxylase/phosphopantothenate--cysteine ligase CoaBC [Saprospiraceae bacterium]